MKLEAEATISEVQDVIQVATILDMLRHDYGINTEPARGELETGDWHLIASAIKDGWTSDSIVRNLAEGKGWNRVSESD